MIALLNVEKKEGLAEEIWGILAMVRKESGMRSARFTMFHASRHANIIYSNWCSHPDQRQQITRYIWCDTSKKKDAVSWTTSTEAIMLMDTIDVLERCHIAMNDLLLAEWVISLCRPKIADNYVTFLCKWQQEGDHSWILTNTNW